MLRAISAAPALVQLSTGESSSAIRMALLIDHESILSKSGKERPRKWNVEEY